MSLGKNLLKAREAKGLTQGELSKATGWSEDHPKKGVSQGAISAIEKRNSQSSKHAPALAKALNISLNELLGLSHSQFKVAEQSAEYRDQILNDLSDLEPEDAEVWRAKINAAAIKARRLKQEKREQQLASVGDSPHIAKRTA